MPYLKVLSQYFYSNWGKRRIWASIAGNQAETAGEDDCFTLIMKNAFCLVKVTWRTCSGICSSTAHVIPFLLRVEAIRGKRLQVSTYSWRRAHEGIEAKICMDRRKVRPQIKQETWTVVE